MYRIVHNPQTGLYRIERRGLLGWAFVVHPETRDYLDFDDVEAARDWLCQHSRPGDQRARRWQVVHDCDG